MTPAFTRVLLVGDVPPTIIAGEPLAVPAGLTDRAGRLPVGSLIECGARMRASPDEPLLIITDRDLAMPSCESLFAYADRERGVAVISTHRLLDGSGGARLQARVRNEIAHEWGHLRGLKHCRSSQCVMSPATCAADLDRRPETTCARCTSGGWAARIRNSVAACVFLGSIVATLNYVPDYLIGPPPETPFTCMALDPSGAFSRAATGPDDHAHIYFRGRELFELVDKAGNDSIRDRSLPFAERLNEFWRAQHPPLLTVGRTSAGVARIYAGREPLFDVLAGDVRDGDLMETAQRWTNSLNAALRSKPDSTR